MENKFKIGDKVINKIFGIGKIIRINEDLHLPYLVEFDKENIALHDGDGSGKPNHCYWTNENANTEDENIRLFTIKDILKNGDILVSNEGNFIYFETDSEKNLISDNDGWMPLNDYDENLKNSDEEFSFYKIYRFNYLGNLTQYIKRKKNLDDAELIWEYKPEPEIIEMTVAEIEEKLGINNLRIKKED